MTIEKSEVRLATLREVGKMLEESSESAKFEIYKARGAIAYLKRAAAGMQSLHELIGKALDDEELEFESGYQVSSYASEIVEKARNICVDLSSQAEREVIAYAGRLQAMETSVKSVEKKFLAEKGKLEHLVNRMENPELDEPRQTGDHPGLSLKELRQQEDEEETVLEEVEDAKEEMVPEG